MTYYAKLRNESRNTVRENTFYETLVKLKKIT